MKEMPRYAARCAYLRMTLDSKQIGGVVNLCQHLVRDGSDCVGPFLDDAETTCGLWELKPGSSPILVDTYAPSRTYLHPEPERRRRPKE